MIVCEGTVLLLLTPGGPTSLPPHESWWHRALVVRRFAAPAYSSQRWFRGAGAGHPVPVPERF